MRASIQRPAESARTEGSGAVGSESPSEAPRSVSIALEAATRFGHRFENLAVHGAAPIQRKPRPHDDDMDQLPGAVPAALPAPAAPPAILAPALGGGGGAPGAGAVPAALPAPPPMLAPALGGVGGAPGAGAVAAALPAPPAMLAPALGGGGGAPGAGAVAAALPAPPAMLAPALGGGGGAPGAGAVPAALPAPLPMLAPALGGGGGAPGAGAVAAALPAPPAMLAPALGGGGAAPAAAGAVLAPAGPGGGGGGPPGAPAAAWAAPAGLPPLPPYAPPSLGTRAENFLAINSPGTQTGVIGGLGAVNSLVTPPAAVAPTSYTSAASGVTGPAGAGLNIASGGADLLATYQGLRNMGQEGGVRGFGRGIRDTFSPQPNETGAQAETRSTAKRLAVDATVNLADAASQGMQAGNAISAVGHAGTSILPAATGLASAGIGAGVQTIVAGRAGYRAYRAHQHKTQIDAVRAGPPMSANMTAAADHMSGQLAKRRKRNILGGIGAGIGALGGGALLAGLLGAGALFTPIGWGLAGAGALAALGLGAYKLYRHFQKKNAPAGQRLGEERALHARNLYQAASSPVHAPHPDRADALRILASHGITHAQATDPNKGEQLIRRKLEGW